MPDTVLKARDVRAWEIADDAGGGIKAGIANAAFQIATRKTGDLIAPAVITETFAGATGADACQGKRARCDGTGNKLAATGGKSIVSVLPGNIVFGLDFAGVVIRSWPR